MAASARCPKCNHPNESGAVQCANCHAPLIQQCPVCGTPRPWYVPRCLRCDASAVDASLFSDIFRAAPDRLLRNRYQLRETVSSGRVTVVYRAIDAQSPQASVAVKEISPVALFRADERREAERQLYASAEHWARVSHPNVARLIECFQERDRYYVVFEFVPGWSGDRLIAERALRVTPDLARNWGAQLAEALACLHEQQPPLYAPFLTPGHIMITPQGVAKLVGFGLGRFFNPSGYGPAGSTRGYAAPELDDSPPTPASDSFALGRVLYALLIKHPLEKGMPRQAPLRQAVPGISGQLVKAIARAAHRDAAQRYQSMTELRDALWEEPLGPLTPVPDWYARISASAEAPYAAAPTPSAPGEASMEALGFAPDPRFGPRRQTVAEPLAPASAAGAVGAPVLTVYPRAFRLTDLRPDETRRLVLRLRNTGDADLQGTVVSHLDWVRAPSRSFRIPPGRQAQVILTAKADLPPSGQVHEPQALAIESNAGRQWIAMDAEMRVGPLLVVETPVLDFGVFETDGQRQLDLVVRNAGRQVLSGQAISRAGWLRVAPASFRCAPGEATTLRATADAGKLPRGPQRLEEAIAIDSDGGQAQVAAQAWRTVPELDLGATHIDLGELTAGAVTERYLLVGNTGDGALIGGIRSLLPWIRVFPEEIRCQPGEMVQHTVIVDTAGLADGVLEAPRALRVQTNGGVATLSLRGRISAPVVVIETEHLDFGVVPLGETALRQVTLHNHGSAPYQATLTPLVPWLTPEEQEIHCPPRGNASLAVRVDGAFFSQGQRLMVPAALQIMAAGEHYEISAAVVIQQPALRVEPEAVDFGYVSPAEPAVRTLIVANDGTGPLAWTAQTDAQWLEVQPTMGVCQPGETVSVRLAAYALALEAGVSLAESALVINSDGGRAKIPLRLGIAAPLLSADSPLLDLGISHNMRPVSGSLRLFNRGLGLLQGRLSVDRLWLSLDRVSFACEMGRSIEIGMRTDMDEFPKGESHDAALVQVESNGGQMQIEVRLAVELAPEIEAPERLVLEQGAPGEPPQGRLVLRNVGLASAHVTLAADDAAIAISRPWVDIKAGKSARIAVQWQGDIPPVHKETPEIRVVCEDEIRHVPVFVATIPVEGKPETALSSP